MEIAEVQSMIQAGVPGCRLSVAGEGCNFSAVIVADAFEGVAPVKRQQMVLKAVKEPLSTGALHAISMKVYTPSEWASEPNKEPGSENL